MSMHVDPQIVPPVLVLVAIGIFFLNIGLQTSRNGRQSRFTMKQIALGLDKPSMAYNPRTKTVLLGTLPEVED